MEFAKFPIKAKVTDYSKDISKIITEVSKSVVSSVIDLENITSEEFLKYCDKVNDLCGGHISYKSISTVLSEQFRLEKKRNRYVSTPIPPPPPTPTTIPVEEEEDNVISLAEVIMLYSLLNKLEK